MASGEGFSSNKAPLFDGTNYAFWKIRMKTYLSALGFGTWDAVKKGYTPPPLGPSDEAGRKAFECDAKARNALMCGLVDSELVKVIACKSAKDVRIVETVSQPASRPDSRPTGQWTAGQPARQPANRPDSQPI